MSAPLNILFIPADGWRGDCLSAIGHRLRFHTRCAYAEPCCQTEVPEWRDLEGGHSVACHYAEQLSAKPTGEGKKAGRLQRM